MKRWLSAVVAVALIVTLVWIVEGSSGDGPVAGTVAAAAQDDESEGSGDSGDRRSDRGRGASAGHGPPPWAEGPGRGNDREDDRAWHEAWRDMTPQQREQTMSRFAEEHAAGMRAWGECRSQGRDDCEKPLPPGLAKKQLRP